MHSFPVARVSALEVSPTAPPLGTNPAAPEETGAVDPGHLRESPARAQTLGLKSLLHAEHPDSSDAATLHRGEFTPRGLLPWSRPEPGVPGGEARLPPLRSGEVRAHAHTPKTHPRGRWLRSATCPRQP